MDIATILDPATLGCDWAMAGPDLQSDQGLTTAVILSLFCDQRAQADDVLPDNSGDPRGWWGDAYLPPLASGAQDRWGSRLWLHARDKATAKTAAAIKADLAAALQWLIDDGVAASVAVATAWRSNEFLAATIAIPRVAGAGGAIDHRWDLVWSASLAAPVSLTPVAPGGITLITDPSSILFTNPSGVAFG